MRKRVFQNLVKRVGAGKVDYYVGVDVYFFTAFENGSFELRRVCVDRKSVV